MSLRNSIAVAVVLHSVTIVTPVLIHASQAQSKVIETNDLQTCLQKALENNRLRKVSQFAVAMAEARHRQALAGYWPRIGVRGGYQVMDEPPNYIFPAATFDIPMGGGIPVTVPEQDIQLMDEESFRASMDASWLLYDGGMRKGYREQGKGVVEMMKQESRRTDLEIIDSVKRMYFGAVLATRLHGIGRDTLARMEATLYLTENMYKQGSGRVKKTDWLNNKVMVESIRSMVALLEKNELMALAALANIMGLAWDASVKPADSVIAFTPFKGDLNGLVTTAYRFNPDWVKIEAGIRAAEGAVLTAQSGYRPKLAVTGQLHKWWDDLDTGYATPQNKAGWMAGIGIEIPVFDGFLTRNKLAETRARVAKIKEEQFLLKEGVGLQIRDAFLSLQAAQKSHQATQDAMKAAEENSDLNTRAYKHGLSDTEDVIRAQLMEALMSAQHYKVGYDHIALQSKLNLIVGTEVLDKLNTNE